MMQKIVTTEDGSHSLYTPQFDENYHSIHGAVQESQHVFIQAGLANYLKCQNDSKKLAILEMGFGTGLNAFLTYLYAQKQYLAIHYTSIEAYPVDLETAQQLNYFAHPEVKGHAEQRGFETMHQSNWGKSVVISPQFTLHKIEDQLENVSLPANKFDLVYFDAFSPNIQPELWTATIFEQIYKSMKIGGMMTTYCAKGSVKRALKSVGFNLESIPGPPGKREMTRVTK